MGVLLPILAFFALATAPAMAQDRAVRADAVSMVKKAVVFAKAYGPEKAYAAFNDKSGKFADRDLYVVVYGLDGKCLAHGANEKQIGKDLIGLTDVDGKYFVKERVEMVKAQPNGAWQKYKFSNPVSRKIEPKEMYCERHGDTAICAGVYSSAG